MRAHLRPLALALSFVTAASCSCGPDAIEPDGGTSSDAGHQIDGGGTMSDAGTVSDAGTMSDAGVMGDAGLPLDGGLDAGPGVPVSQLAATAGRAVSPNYALEFSVGATTQAPHRSQSPRYRLEGAARLFTTESP